MHKSAYKKKELKFLLQSAKEGHIKALEELIKRTQKQIWAMFSHLTNKKEDISDLTQETLLKMARSLYQLKDIDKFKPWLNQIITSVYYDHASKKHDFAEIDIDSFNEIKDRLGCEPGEKCLFNELEKIINSALLTLPKDLRITLVLREFEGLSYNDIAKITNTAIGTVKSRISRARNKLQQELKDFI